MDLIGAAVINVNKHGSRLDLAYGLVDDGAAAADDIAENDKLKVDAFLAGTIVWRCAIKNGSISHVVLLTCLGNAHAAAESRRNSNEQLRQAGVDRSANNAFARDNDTVRERQRAHHVFLEMLNAVGALGMCEWLADLLDLDFLAHHSFTNTESCAMTARSCPSGFGVCEGILYGPFQHGKLLPVDELFECVAQSAAELIKEHRQTQKAMERYEEASVSATRVRDCRVVFVTWG